MFFECKADVRVLKKLLCGASLGALAAAIPTGSQAQDVSETVTVSATGTSIRGIAPVGSNLLTVDATAIKATGALTTNQILGQIPQLANTFNTNTVPPTAINIGGVRPSIRFNPAQNIVGGAATLVLLDGYNMVGVSGLATAPDAGLIPTIVLRQVDVLPDGASSIYGANAITGVINFVTYQDYQGFQANASLGIADGYTAFNTSAMGGTNWGSGGAYLAYEHKSNTYLMAKDRPYTVMDLRSIGGRDSRATQCALANITAPGGLNYAVNSTAVPNTPGALAANVTGPFGGLNSTTNAGLFNRCDTNSYSSLYPKEEQDSVYGVFHQRVIPGVEFSAKVLWSNRLNSQRLPQLTATATINNTNPYFQSIAGETTQSVQFSFAPFLGSNSYENSNAISVFLFTPKLNVELPFGDWQANLLMNYGRSTSDGFQRTVNTTQLNLAMAQGTSAGVTSAPLVASSGAAGNALNPYNLNASNAFLVNSLVNNASTGKAVQHQLQFQASANGTLFTLPGGAVKAAFGLQHAMDDYIATWGINKPLGQITGGVVPGGQLASVKPRRITESAFGEVVIPLVSDENEIPLVHSFSFNASGRWDNYSDFGTTTNYKLGFSYQPVEDLTIRGTKGSSYAAPSLADTSAPDTRFIYTPQRVTANAIVPVGTSPADALRPSISTPGGNPLLGPELGQTWSIGGDFRPGEYFGVDFTGLEFSITAWHITFSNQIGLTPFNNTNLTLFSGAYDQYYIINPTLAQIQARYATAGVAVIGFPGSDLASAFNQPGQNNPFIFYDLRRNNLGKARLDGIDFALSYTTDFEDFGTVGLGIQGTVNTQNVTQASPLLPVVNIVKYGVPLSAATAYLQVSSGPVSGRVWVQYSPGFAISPTSQSFTLYGQRRAEAFHPVNTFVSYDLTNVFDWTSGASVSLTVNNIGDENPPILLAGGTSSPVNFGTGIVANGGTLGRYFVVGLQKVF